MTKAQEPAVSAGRYKASTLSGQFSAAWDKAGKAIKEGAGHE